MTLTSRAAPDPRGGEARALPLSELVERAREREPTLEVSFVRVHFPGDEGSVVDVAGRTSDVLFGYAKVRVAATGGEVLTDPSLPDRGAIGHLLRWAHGLHYGWFGGPLTRGVLALLAVLTWLTILSGNWVFLERRDARRASRGHRALARLTLAGAVGVVPAIAAMFAANRLVPFSLEAHERLEVAAFVVAWLLASVRALVGTPLDERRVARDLIGAASALFAITVVASHLTHATTGVDAALTAIACVLACVAFALGAQRDEGAATRVRNSQPGRHS